MRLIDIDDALVDFNEEGVDAGCTLIAFTNINTDFYLVNSLVFLSANNLYANKVLEPINSVQVWAGPNHNHISWGLSTDKVSNYVVYSPNWCTVFLPLFT